MTSHDILMILVYTFPMFLFSVYPGIVVSDYLDKNYNIQETQKRAVMIGVSFLFALTLASFLHFA